MTTTNDKNSKIRVAVLYGGRSGEHEVSLLSAASIVKNLDPTRYEVIPIGIDKQGQWLLNDIKQIDVATVKALPLQTTTSAILPSPAQLTTPHKNTYSNGKHSLFDVVFPVLHGPLGEDGTVQGLLELAEIPYVGPGVLSSAVAMDKDVSKRLAAAAGLAVTPHLALKRNQWLEANTYWLSHIPQQLKLPVFVKPANLGSSVGVHKVKRVEDLAAAIEDAFQYDTKIIIEKALNVREIELAVLESSDYGAPALVSLPGEIIPHAEFYSYEAKYLDEKGAELVYPAELTTTQVQQAQHMTRRAFEVLECEGMARIDLFLDRDSGEFIFNEANTIPGFTQHSMYPKLWEASGILYADLLDRLIKLAFARQERKKALKRDWEIK